MTFLPAVVRWLSLRNQASGPNFGVLAVDLGFISFLLRFLIRHSTDHTKTRKDILMPCSNVREE